jgi:hypothetical protein
MRDVGRNLKRDHYWRNRLKEGIFMKRIIILSASLIFMHSIAHADLQAQTDLPSF